MGTNDIIIFSLQPWDIQIGSNCKNIALELSRTHRVLYINSPLDFKTLFTGSPQFVARRKKAFWNSEPHIEEVADNLFVHTPGCLLYSINMLPHNRIYNFFNRENNLRLARSVRSAVKKTGIKNFWILNDSDVFRSFYMKEFLDPKAYFYYSRDNLVAVPYWSRHGSDMEPRLVKKSTACFTNSNYLKNLHAPHNPHVYYVGQGCDLSEFDPYRDYKRPADLPPGGPLIGYVGALSSLRLDIELLVQIAEKKPDWKLVLVGPEDEAFRNSRLHSLTNVFFPGNKRPDELAQYISFFDVCINPQVVNDLTIGNYPRKIDEYLAMGKPVVATRTSTMEMFSGHVLLAGAFDGYLTAIGDALAGNLPSQKEDRIAFAREHTWDNSVREMLQVAGKFLDPC